LNKFVKKKARKQLKAQKRLDEEQQRIESEIQQQRQVAISWPREFLRCVPEAREQAEFAHLEKKTKAVIFEITQLDSERTALREKEREEQSEVQPLERPVPNPQ
jgi:hypothetical protein